MEVALATALKTLKAHNYNADGSHYWWCM